MKMFALIVAGGMGARMGNNIPKQFLMLSGKPVLMHTIQIFFNFDPEIEVILVLPENQISTWEKYCIDLKFDIKHSICPGGEERFFSVKNGLDLITNEGIVFIHDGVRPLVSNETLSRCYDSARRYGNAIPVMQVSESLRKIKGAGNVAVDRQRYFLIQTPQTFIVSEIKKAYNIDYSSQFTDDASVLETSGKSIHLVQGNRENIKITYPGDLEIAQINIK